MSIPTSETFAEEVKEERLQILYRVTGAIALLVGVFGTTLGLAGYTQLAQWPFVAAIGAVIAGCYGAHHLLSYRFAYAVWAYALGSVVGIGVLLYFGDLRTVQMLPYSYPLIVFIVGLLLRSDHTLVMAILTAIVTLLAPALGGHPGGVLLTVHQAFAIVLTFVSAGLSAQVTGELYQVADWALMNYKRERRTNDELFEKRQELQKTLKRTEALSERLKDANEELEAARDAAEKAKYYRGQFLANMSHELRTPLNAIIGFSETMLNFPVMYDNTPLPDAYREDLDQIYNSGTQLLQVINDILDLARVDAGKLEVQKKRVALKPIIDSVVATARGLLSSKPVQLTQDLPETLPDALGDENRLRQVLLNLYSNAVKYTDEGSIHLQVRTLENDGMIEFSVRDTGEGIDPGFQDRLFAEFQQARHSGRDPRSGAGLGLAITKQLLDLMGGRIWLESTPGEGSTFYFTVPLYQEQTEASADQPSGAANGQHSDASGRSDAAAEATADPQTRESSTA